ncbi:tyrosine-type recombinase/integrase [Lactobacillus johnsonii]|uniref:tyrosine-type recombinase/integrase n=1 Tax=Lactobacillus johnsonii TaxID=33959 RepID=UPI002B258F6E|nr:site-specific integrase [Lactobacillus johnsonii]
MPKRKNTSIKDYKLKSGKKRYEFVISLGQNSNGDRIQVHRRGFKTYAEAEAVFNKLSQTKPDNFVKQKQIKVSELRDLWFENYKTQVKESTANKNKQVFDNHVIPDFGNQYIDKITVAELQKWADRKAKQIVKYRDAINEFNALFEYGIRLNYVSENPLKRIIIPKKTSRPRRDTEHNVYTRGELNQFLEVAKEYGLVQYTYFKLLSATGLRKSEALALTWQDIDLKAGTLSVNKTLAYGLDNKTIIQPPKSPKSKRILPISDSLKEVLIDYKQKQKIISNKLFHTIKGTYLKMSKPDQWLKSIYAKDHEKKVKYAKTHNLKEPQPDLHHITVHGFRHTFATLLIAETNVKPKTVQMLLGHENIQMTLDIYTHVNNKNKEDAVNALKQLNI